MCLDSFACELTTRDPQTGELLQANGQTLNAAFQRIEGYDVTATYQFDTRWGRWSIDWDSVYYAEHLIEIPAGNEPRSRVGNYNSRDPYWRIRSNVGLEWRRGDFGAGVGARYYDALDEACFVDPSRAAVCSSPDVESPAFDGLPENRIDDRWYFDLQASWNSPWGADIRGGVQNVLDEDPPVAYSTINSFDPQYPVPGRFFYVSYTQRF